MWSNPNGAQTHAVLMAGEPRWHTGGLDARIMSADPMAHYREG
jgi:hypothetical protein